MEALKFSLFSLFLLSSCSISAENTIFEIRNNVKGCFTLIDANPHISDEIVLLRAPIETKIMGGECPCKSALMQYTSYQSNEGQTSNLITGSFTIMGRDQINLPIAVQKQLIFQKTPIQIMFSCASL